jgi:hypothetical protein
MIAAWFVVIEYRLHISLRDPSQRKLLAIGRDVFEA